MRMILAVLMMLAAGIGLAAPNAPSAPPADNVVKGEVLEFKDVDPYTYLRLKTKDGEIWAAVNKATVKKGAEVTILDPAMMMNFTSKSLNKTFDRIIFGTLAGAGAAAAPAAAAPAAPAAGQPGAPANMTMGAMHASMPQPADVGDVKVAKATGPNARTVAEIINAKGELKGKPVLVRGKVVKFTPEVMGKNWIHLRDGTGLATNGTNDILVTTKEETKVGDVILVKGVVRTDVNLGSGYAYAVMVDEGALQK